MTHAVAPAVGELDPIVKSSRRLRVLMAHWDGSGNTPPQRALARELTRRGHDVHVLSHDTLAEAVIADGGRFHALPSAPQWNPALPRTNEEEGAFVVQNVVGSSAFATDFLAVRDAVRPDICLIDAMLISTLNVAIERRLPFSLDSARRCANGKLRGRSALRGRAARRSPVSSDYDVIPTARFYISEFLCAHPQCLNGAAAPDPPALLRVRLLRRPHRDSGRPTAGRGYRPRARCAGPPSGREGSQR